MLDQIKGLHHVTSMAANAQTNNQFFTNALGLRRVEKTVNFDAPDVYHLYYGDENGAPGTIMTYFPFPKMAQGRPGTGEVGTTVYSIPEGSIGFWSDRLAKLNVTGLKAEETFGEKRLNFAGPLNFERMSIEQIQITLDGRRLINGKSTTTSSIKTGSITTT